MGIEIQARRSTKIEWTDQTWNPVVGCHLISSGCKNCYAKSMHTRHFGNPKQPKYIKPFEEVVTWEDELETPYQWKEVKRVFVCSMSDLFNKDVPTEFIHKVFDVMNATPHYYQILTKRSERLKELAPELTWTPNIWAGVTVENGDHLNRIDHLRDVPASIRFISFEPLIGELGKVNLQGIHWAIAGGESGGSLKSLRRLNRDWVDLLREQCDEGGVAFFFKQWGRKEFNPDQSDPTIPAKGEKEKKDEKTSKGGHLIDGISYWTFPEFPTYYPDVALREELYKLEETISNSTKEFTQSWVSIGESLSIIKERMEGLGSGKLYWQAYLGVNSFQEYCKTRLQLSRETATQMRQAFEIIRGLKPELLINGAEQIPSYTKLRKLGPHQDMIIKNPGKYEEIVEHAFDETPRSKFNSEVNKRFKKRNKAKAKPAHHEQADSKYSKAIDASDWDKYIELIKTDLSSKLIPTLEDEFESLLEQLKSMLSETVSSE
ncbi:MAG: phage Gp37/Gp68 family protein [Candidatus Marinimicrobia bacterium]|jgi:protein gp37|nr:phage Gp37/Gp68 family protein [Candidatus Neomarinimicrobiota bacterium]MBT4360557.1 phage Gp37/Gp68 family protein [Candidatus Neomarinimicrobiota bacterium]MBT4715497.1 phage Gp37/Gp68 family protein [Candidatus Neomarinimicrobiota bacterium]MBT4945919.1 phage Gp37/Gp68 family protein [Candidatus Neomarinimicrobiota bacterium]MBT5271685.1 phage Gp37/Gp68 family protein [Candidatus Neomarinimicrobiota bacterium]